MTVGQMPIRRKGRFLKIIGKLLTAAGLLVALANNAWSFDVSPKGTRFDQDAVKAWSKWWDRTISKVTARGLPMFKGAVHEEITHRAYGCTYEGSGICGDPDAQYASPYVIAGVRWNDDPPFQLQQIQSANTSCKIKYEDGRPMTIRFITQPLCWSALFLSAEKQIKNNPSLRFDVSSQAALPLRSHFGDLQFLHSMASADGEDPVETRNKILGWAEMIWGVVRGNYRLETWMKDIDLPAVQQYFGGSGWRIQELYTLGDGSLRLYVADVAFGSLLHMVEDSFAAGHVERMEPANNAQCPGGAQRAPGPIVEFHSYLHQSTKGHAAADTRHAFVNNRQKPDVVDVVGSLVEMRASNAEWSIVSAYLMCVYDLAPGVRKSSSGGF